MTEISRQGVTVEVESGWEAELMDHPGKRVVLHMSNRPLPRDRSDFGGESIGNLRGDDIFISILEYEPSDAGRGIFKRNGIPAFVPADFDPYNLHRFVLGQTGAQKFFSINGRSFCCYVVIGRPTPGPGDIGRINRSIAGFRMSVVRDDRGTPE